MLICVGEFFGIDVEMNQKVIDGKLEFPITTYVLGEHFLVFFDSFIIFTDSESSKLTMEVYFDCKHVTHLVD